MKNILLDYFFPIVAVNPVQAASTAFLKQACIVVAPKEGVTPGTVTLCTSMAQVAALTDNAEAQQFFNAGHSRIYVLPMEGLDLAAALVGHNSDFYTLIISSDFDDDDVEATQASGVLTVTSYANLLTTTPDTVTVGSTVFTAQAGAVTPGEDKFQAATSNDVAAASLAAQINEHAVTKLIVVATAVGAVVTIKAKDTGFSGNNIALVYTDNAATVGITLAGLLDGKLSGGDGFFPGTFNGVVAVSSNDIDFLTTQAAIENRAPFYTSGSVAAKNMVFAFGKMLSNQLNWKNQQYIQLPFANDVDELGEAENLFDKKIGFAISDDEYGNRLALFVAGKKAIAAPYIIRNLQIDIQSKGLQYISANQPDYTLVQAALLEDEEQKVVQSYIERQWIESGTIEIKLEQQNFVASGYIEVSEPRALWRIFGQITQTL